MTIFKKGMRWVGYLNAAVGLVSGICIVIAMLAIVWEVVSRYLFNSPTTWAAELTSVYLLPATIFLGAAYTLQVDGFIRVDIFLSRFSKKKRAIADIVAYIAGLVMVYALIWRGWEISYRSFMTGETTASTLLGWPIYPSHAMVWIGSLFLALELILKILSSIELFFKSDLKA